MVCRMVCYSWSSYLPMDRAEIEQLEPRLASWVGKRRGSKWARHYYLSVLTIIARNLGHNQLAAGAKQGSSRALQLICMISSLLQVSSVQAFTKIRDSSKISKTFNFPAQFSFLAFQFPNDWHFVLKPALLTLNYCASCYLHNHPWLETTQARDGYHNKLKESLRWLENAVCNSRGQFLKLKWQKWAYWNCEFIAWFTRYQCKCDQCIWLDSIGFHMFDWPH